MKKKILSIILVFIISFSFISGSYQKKTEASALLLSYAIFKAGVSFTAFTGFASLMAVNGYHMQLSDLAVAFADKYYDYANGVYTEKGSKINVLEKLSLATASFLSGNDPLSYSELNEIKESIVTDFPIIQDFDLIENITVHESSQGALSGYFDVKEGTNYRIISPEYEGKFMKISLNDEYYYYVHWVATDYFLYAGTYWPVIRFIGPNGKSVYKWFRNNLLHIGAGINEVNVFVRNTTTQQYSTLLTLNTLNHPDELEQPYSVEKDSFASNAREFINAYPNYYPAISGKASTTDELVGLMNTDEYLQKEVAKLLENQKVNEQNTLEVPTLVDGVITYPTADIPENPDVPYSPTETWYNNLLGWVSNIPDLLIGGITDLFNDTLIPALDSLKNIVLQIPDLLSNIWNWILDFPDLLYSWFVPTSPMIAETWDPVIDLWDLKLDPIIGPFKTLTFYETEYEDISVPLKFGSYEKEHKIIDFQYIKSQRDSIKSLIRSFLWILIIFFNLDQIHRLIRNQSLLNTYVRKIDKGA